MFYHQIAQFLASILVAIFAGTAYFHYGPDPVHMVEKAADWIRNLLS